MQAQAVQNTASLWVLPRALASPTTGHTPPDCHKQRLLLSPGVQSARPSSTRAARRW
jgi:hypothetical protein